MSIRTIGISEELEAALLVLEMGAEVYRHLLDTSFFAGQVTPADKER